MPNWRSSASRITGAAPPRGDGTGPHTWAGSYRSVADHGAQALAQRVHGGEDGGRLVAAVRHAVVAARVLAAAEVVPVGGLQEFLPGADVAVVHQVAGTLPALQRVQRHAPRGALEVGLALKEVQVERGVVEPPLLAAAVGERLAEQLAGLRHAEEAVLVGRLGGGVAGGDLQPVDLELVVDVVQRVDQ